MNVFNTTPYVFFPHDVSPAPTLPALTLIVRGTFSLPAQGPAIARPKAEQPPLRGDEQHLDDLGRSLAYATDLVPAKPRGEVLVYGTCHTPDGQPRPSHDVAIQVGPIQKTLRVTGPRVFVEGVMGRVAPGPTAPFTAMPSAGSWPSAGCRSSRTRSAEGSSPSPTTRGSPSPTCHASSTPGAR